MAGVSRDMFLLRGHSYVRQEVGLNPVVAPPLQHLPLKCPTKILRRRASRVRRSTRLWRWSRSSRLRARTRQARRRSPRFSKYILAHLQRRRHSDVDGFTSQTPAGQSDEKIFSLNSRRTSLHHHSSPLITTPRKLAISLAPMTVVSSTGCHARNRCATLCGQHGRASSGSRSSTARKPSTSKGKP